MRPKLRIAALGNSHIGALKTGWDRIRDTNPDVSVTFFAAPGARMLGMQAQGDRLVPRYEKLGEIVAFTSGGISEIVASDYDLFMIHGMGFKLLDTRRETPSNLSSAVRTALRDDMLFDNNTMILAKELRKIRAEPLFLSHNPLPATTRKTSSDKGEYDADADETEVILAARGMKLVRVPEILRQGLSTPKRFSVGSVRLPNIENTKDESHGDEDRIHMNTDWGEIWMQHFLQNLT